MNPATSNTAGPEVAVVAPPEEDQQAPLSQKPEKVGLEPDKTAKPISSPLKRGGERAKKLRYRPKYGSSLTDERQRYFLKPNSVNEPTRPVAVKLVCHQCQRSFDRTLNLPESIAVPEAPLFTCADCANGRGPRQSFCAHCYSVFHPTKAWQKFCSSRCRTAACRARNAWKVPFIGKDNSKGHAPFRKRKEG